MSDQLPSREEVASETAWIDKGGNNIGHWRKIVEAYAAGRLVDREAIDYEAAAERMNDAFGDRDNRLRIAHNLVDAAIGDGDE